MNFNNIAAIDAEVAYRQHKVARDFALAQQWKAGVRRAGRRVSTLWAHTPATQPTVRRAAAH